MCFIKMSHLSQFCVSRYCHINVSILYRYPVWYDIFKGMLHHKCGELNDTFVMCFVKMSHLSQISDFEFDTPFDSKGKDLCSNTRCIIPLPRFVIYYALECAIIERISIEDWNIKKAIILKPRIATCDSLCGNTSQMF